MSELLFEAIPVADLTVFARNVAAREVDPLTGVIPNRNITGFRTRQTRVSRVTTAAKFRSFDAETPIGKRPIAATVSQVELAPLGQKLPLRESEILARYLADGGELADLISAVYDDTENNVSAIVNRALQLRGEFLFSGAVSIAENGFIQEADFGLDPTHNLALSALDPWNLSGADPIADELDWIEIVKADSGEDVTATVVSTRVLRAMLTSAAYTGGAGVLVERISVAQLQETRAAFGLPPIVVCDAKVGGVRVTPDDKIALVTASVGEFQWGDTVEGLELLGSKAVESASVHAPKIVASAWKTTDPVNIWSKANATGLVVAGDINGLFVAEVLSDAVES